MTNYEDDNTSVTVSVIKDLIKRVEDYEKRASVDRAAFQASIEASIVQLRKDFQRALTPFMIENIDHKQLHRETQLAVFQKEEKEALERKARQDVIDRQFTFLTVGLLILGLLIIVVIVILLVGRVR